MTCPICQLVAELTEHRDRYATEWSQRRVGFNFALILARRHCDGACEDAAGAQSDAQGPAVAVGHPDAVDGTEGREGA